MYRLVTVPDMPASFVETTFHVRYAETDQMGIVHRFLSSTFFLTYIMKIDDKCH